MFERDTFKRDLNEDLTDTRFSCFLTNFASVTMDLRQSSCQNAPWSKIHFQFTSKWKVGNNVFIIISLISECELVNLQHYTVLYTDLQQENLKLIDYYVNKV